MIRELLSTGLADDGYVIHTAENLCRKSLIMLSLDHKHRDINPYSDRRYVEDVILIFNNKLLSTKGFEDLYPFESNFLER